jgi:hypothetical protein
MLDRLRVPALHEIGIYVTAVRFNFRLVLVCRIHLGCWVFVFLLSHGRKRKEHNFSTRLSVPPW